jgi:amidase
VAAFTSAFNLSGHPSLTVPVGFVEPMAIDCKCPTVSEIRLPVGLMVVGKWWDESTVLCVGDAVERSADWKELHF